MYVIVNARVCVGAELTGVFLCPRGLKQGEVSLPLLFLLFINELTKDTESGKHGIQLVPDLIELLIFLFADDVVLLSDSAIGLQTQLNVLYNTAKRLDLIVNLVSLTYLFSGMGAILLWMKSGVLVTRNLKL